MKCVLNRNKIISDGNNFFVTNTTNKQLFKLKDINVDRFNVTHTRENTEFEDMSMLDFIGKEMTHFISFNISGTATNYEIIDNLDALYKENNFLKNIPREQMIKALYENIKDRKE